MILTPKNTHIAYRCPVCSAATRGIVGEMSLSTNMLKLKCPCGKSNMAMTYTGNGEARRVSLSVPCLFCGKNHDFTVSADAFFANGSFLLTCPYTNMDICFVGAEERLEAEINRADIELNSLFAELGIESPDELKTDYEDKKGEDFAPENEVYDIVRYLVSVLKDEGGIDCPCHSGNYQFEFTEDEIRLYCTDCGAEYRFSATSVAVAKEYLSYDSIVLKHGDQ